MKEAVEKQRKEQAERERRKAQGIEETEEEEQDEEEEDDEEEESVEPIKHEQGNVLRGFYRGAGSDKFVLTMVSLVFMLKFVI